MCAYQRVETYSNDSSYYEVLGRNLARDRAYVFNFKPHTRYPPGFPAVLALSASVSGGGYVPSILLMPLFGVLGLLASLALLEQDIDEQDGWMVAAIACVWLASSPQFFRYSTERVLSDLPYFFASTAALLLAVRLGQAGRAGGAGRIGLTVLGLSVSVAAAVMFRAAGIALVAAGLAALVTGGRRLPWRSIVGLSVAITAGGAAEAFWLQWALPRASQDWPGEYMDSYITQMMMKDPHRPGLGHATIADVVSRMGHGAVLQMARFSELVTRAPWIDPLWFSPFVIIPLVLVVAGLVDSIRQGRSTVVVWYVVFYLTLYFLWPYDEGTRFVLPIFPLLFLMAWRGVRLTHRLLKARRVRPSLVLAVLAVVSVAALGSCRLEPMPGSQAALSVAFWVAALGAGIASQVGWVGGLSRVGGERGLGRWLGVPILVLSIGIGLAEQARITVANLKTGPASPTQARTIGVAGWLSMQSRDPVVMAQQTAILHRLTGLRMVSFPVVSNDAAGLIARTIRQHGVSYLVVADPGPGEDDYYHPTEQERFRALVSVQPDCCQLAYAAGGYEVYRVETR